MTTIHRHGKSRHRAKRALAGLQRSAAGFLMLSLAATCSTPSSQSDSGAPPSGAADAAGRSTGGTLGAGGAVGGAGATGSLGEASGVGGRVDAGPTDHPVASGPGGSGGVDAGLPHVTGDELFVATSGDDANPGTRDQPLKTLAAAQAAVRRHPDRGKAPINVTV